MRKCACVIVFACAMPCWAESKPDPAAIEFFEKHVRPVLAEHCYQCHGSKKQSVGLRLDNRASALKGSENGPVIVAGNPDKSLLIQAVRQVGRRQNAAQEQAARRGDRRDGCLGENGGTLSRQGDGSP